MATKKEILEELGRLAEKWSEREVVCLNDGAVSFINCVELDDWDEPWRYILSCDKDGIGEMTVARLLECLSENDSDNPDSEGEETEVYVRLDEDDCPRFIDYTSDCVFFEDTVGGEEVIAFRCGDEADTDFLDDVC